MTETMAAGGMPAAAVKYRELRKQYYGGQSYDFSEGALAGLAQRANQANKPDDAIALLELNLEFNPQSSRSYALLGTIYAAMHDNATAIKDFEKALEIDPKNEQAKQQLARLKQ
jgi:cytochrome c-type biogenesis protein CcmH/NrfG